MVCEKDSARLALRWHGLGGLVERDCPEVTEAPGPGSRTPGGIEQPGHHASAQRGASPSDAAGTAGPLSPCLERTCTRRRRLWAGVPVPAAGGRPGARSVRGQKRHRRHNAPSDADLDARDHRGLNLFVAGCWSIGDRRLPNGESPTGDVPVRGRRSALASGVEEAFHHAAETIQGGPAILEVRPHPLEVQVPVHVDQDVPEGREVRKLRAQVRIE